MIIDFTIQNFRSIKQAQTFSMYVEHPKQHLAEHVSYPAGDKIGVLRAAGIYGANASGKSNILLALQALQFVACESGDLKDGAAISCYEPFRLSSETKHAATRFEIEFFDSEQVRYFYAVSFNQKRIFEEVLDYYPSQKKANLFNRSEQDNWETISFGGRNKGGVRRIPFFENNSYLSKAGENAATAKIIRAAYKYLKENIIFFGMGSIVFAPGLFEDRNLINKAAEILSYIDTGIVSVNPVLNEEKINNDLMKKFTEIAGEAFKKLMIQDYLFGHTSEDNEVEFFEEKLESAGTRKLFRFIPALMSGFEDGKVFIWDELESTFHPHVAEMIIALFNDPSINTNNAQLLFTTHNTSLMSPENMRRDQIWFTEKRNGATILYSLDEYDKSKVKNDSPFADWYNEGRFDAIPHIDYLAIANLLRPKNNKQAAQGDGDVNA